MRHFSFLSTFVILLSTVATVTAASAQESKPASAPTSEQASLSPKAQVAELFSALKRERDSDKADGIAKEIVSSWEDYGSATINTLFQRGMTASNDKDFAAALDYFDQVITLEPDYAQAYYRRSFVHFSDGQTKKSMADLYKALELEPRHFGALSELARILQYSGHEKASLQALERFLSLYPADKLAREQWTTLSEKLAGTRG